MDVFLVLIEEHLKNPTTPILSARPGA